MKKVEVTFVDDLSDQVIGQVELSPDALPPSFAQDTTLVIAEANWSVVESIPVESADFIAQGSLTLRLRRVQEMDPNKILFSVPTICEALPAVGKVGSKEEDFRIAEDDWRQIECIPKAKLESIEKEMASILSIHENASQGVGWTNMHLRKEPQIPVLSLPIRDLKKQFGDVKGLSFNGQSHQIENGFSVDLDAGFHLYGVCDDACIDVLCVDAFRLPSSATIKKLGAFLVEHDLLMVDWCRCTQASGEDLHAFFAR